ncbi:MAG: hypothetical protein ACW99Q_13420, partial [Candidatus Kariarchaeaceae archaeon]
ILPSIPQTYFCMDHRNCEYNRIFVIKMNRSQFVYTVLFLIIQRYGYTIKIVEILLEINLVK